ncbi:class C beta-lactamase-related serine hydrolase [Dokdonia sinensis]|uniref:Class C beta-lactamase-related serine hydrolase n=1 Tax=Dokdonia sinensis TaxID=2479847 RepID=A0A3M0GUI8_9FLAO|nr:serine hydrolase [Dokdonia sinensis]RMB60986.1 class C beta-lactamase-related serine hydrolase [Dokdonia sinensis]
MTFRHICITASLALASCATTQKNVMYDTNPAVNLQRILDEEIGTGEDDSAGLSLTVISPELNIDFTGAAGYGSLERNTKLDASQPFRIASLTKVFVATAIVRLREEGLLSLEDPISMYISPAHIDILRKGGYNPDAITLRHCLTHSSGLYDYAEGGPEYIEVASQDPSKRWTRTEQIQFAMDHGKPHGPPGEAYHYSDTGFVLLGEIIEKLTNKNLAQGLRSLLKFDELGMSTTWLESLEPRPDGLLPSVKRYMGTIDATDWDNSVDLYGGGGLASTTRDLGIFLQALFNGKIYENEDSLGVMLLEKEYDPHGKPLPEARLGFGSIQGKQSGIVAYTHSGFWGTLFMHFPKYNCSIAINDTNDGNNEALQKVVNYVVWLGKQK